MKSSIYNVFYQSEGKYYIYNTSKRKILCVSQNIFRGLQGKDIPDRMAKENVNLVEAGFIVRDEKNELNDFMNLFLQAINSKRLEMLILVTQKCNFNCKYCYIPECNDYNKVNFEEMFLHAVEQQIEKYSGIYIEWFGGEPLLKAKEVAGISLRLKKLCGQHKKSYASSITTNGFLLSENILNMLLDGGIKFYQITIDGNAKTHDRLRPLKNGKPTFDTIVGNLTRMKECKKSFRCVIRNNVYSGNLKECNEFIDFFEKEFASDGRFSLYQYPIKDWGGSKVKALADEGLILDSTIYNSNNRYSYCSLEESLEGIICFAKKKNGMVVDFEGNISKCTHFEQCETLGASSCIGKIQSDGNFLMYGKEKKFWEQMNTSVECRHCRMFPYCVSVWCPLKALSPYTKCKERVISSINTQLELYHKQVNNDELLENSM